MSSLRLVTRAWWSRIVVIGIIALSAVAVSAESQQPDFSGRWISEPPPPIPPAREASMQPGSAVRQPDFGAAWGRDIIIRQDSRAVTVEWQPFTAYDLQPPLIFAYPLDGSESANTIVMGRGTQTQRSRAAWDGRALVITTTHADDAQVRQTLRLESPATLLIETVRNSANGQPVTSRTVYMRKDP